MSHQSLVHLLDARAVLGALAKQRSIFHSELISSSRSLGKPSCCIRLDVRLETHPEPGVRLDLAMIDPESQRGVAVELKYMTRLWVGKHGNEPFALKSHGASDLRAYDVVKDVERVERFIEARTGWTGLVVAMTNDASYWRAPTHGRVTNAHAFRLHEGLVLYGERRWEPNTGGAAKGREASLSLRGSYRLNWSDYSRLDASPAGTFRVLIVQIGDAR